MGVKFGKVLGLVTFLILLLLGMPEWAAQPRGQTQQDSFSENGPFQNPAPISEDVLKALLQTDAAKQGLDLANKSQKADPAQLFRAAEVHLNHAGQVDLVVVGVCPMCGADNAWFWIVGSAAKNPRVILVAGGTELQLLNSTSKGYRDLQSVWSSPSETETTTYHFNGTRYELRKRKSTRNHS
jgi:hypothetical protein